MAIGSITKELVIGSRVRERESPGEKTTEGDWGKVL